MPVRKPSVYRRAHLYSTPLLALFFFLLCYNITHAESLVYTDTVPIQAMNWSEPLTFPQFDPSLGILTSVEITVSGDISGSIGYENFPGQTPISVTGQVSAALLLNLPQSQLLLASRELISVTDSAGIYDGSIDFGGTSGATHFYVGTLTNQRTYIQPLDLQPYIGMGSLSIPLSANSQWDAGGGSANIVIALRTDGGGRGIIRYVYAIPEITIKKFTNSFDADDPNASDVPELQSGTVVTWSYVVTNTGTITIPSAAVTVTDSQPGISPTLVSSSDANSDNLLSPGEVWRYQATGIVQDLTAPTLPVTIVNGCNPGGTAAPGFREAYNNIGTVTVPGAQASDPSHYCNPSEPGIVIKKQTNGFEADGANDQDVPQLQPGAVVTWSYVVTNSGNITFALATVVVTDSHLGVTPVLVAASDVNGDSLLAPGEVWRYTATGLAENLAIPQPGTTVVNGCNPSQTQVPGDQPTYVNLGQVTVPGATASDPSHYCNPPTAAIQLEKSVYLGHNGGVGCPGGEAVTDQVGAPITYCFDMTNTGGTYLDTLIFTDTMLGIDLNDLVQISGTTPLAPNAHIVYYYESTVPSSARLNRAEVEGNPTDDQGRDIPGLENPRDEDTASVSPVPTGEKPGDEPTATKLFIPMVNR